jgi:hypothetical protein
MRSGEPTVVVRAGRRSDFDILGTAELSAVTLGVRLGAMRDIGRGFWCLASVADRKA